MHSSSGPKVRYALLAAPASSNELNPERSSRIKGESVAAGQILSGDESTCQTEAEIIEHKEEFTPTMTLTAVSG
jgi:hypothetical protein